MNKSYLVCKDDRVLYQVNCGPESYAAIVAAGLSLVESEADPALVYMSGQEIKSRPIINSTLTGLMLANLPIPCDIYIKGRASSRHHCTDGSAELSFSQPGTYTIIVSAWPYLDKEFTIENPA